MPSVERALDIKAPPHEVFAVITDPRRAPEWNPSVVEVSDLVGYPIAEGSTWRQTVLVVGRPVHLSCRVTRYEPPLEGIIAVSGDQQGRVWTRCEPIEAGTRVTQGIEFTPPGGILGQLAGGLMHGMIEHELEQTLQRQRETIEQRARRSDGSGTS